jgi:hypothetical protein
VTHFTFHIIVNLRRIICVFLSVIVYIFYQREKQADIIQLFQTVDKLDESELVYSFLFSL